MFRSLSAPRRLLVRLCLGLVLAALGAAPALATELLTLRSARVVSLTAPVSVPPAEGHDEAVTLPDDWLAPWAGATQEQARWYRLRFEPPAVPAGDLLGVYLARACSNADIYLNGQLLSRGGRMSDPITRNCYRSQFVVLPTSLLRPGSNELAVQVAGFPLSRVSGRQRAGGLSEVLIGSYDDLRDLHERQLFWNVTFAQIVAATLVMIGVVMLALAWVRRVPHLMYFGIVSLGWAALTARIWWRDIPLPNHVLELLGCMAFVPLAVCSVLFLLRYCGVRWRIVDGVLWLQCLVMPAALLLAGPDRLFAAAVVCYSILAIEVFAAIGYCLAHVWRTRRHEFWLLGSILAVVTAVIAIEMGVQDRLLSIPHVHLIHFAIPLLFGVLAFRLVKTLAEALTAAETARQQLEQRVHEISAEIERNFSHLAEVRVEQVAEKERKRIAADLHDDLGAKLLTIVHTSNDERISTLAREALEEMRLSVRGIAGKPVQLADALADWRAETVSRLGEADIEIEWHSTELATPRTLAARSYVQTTRVLREAISNLIKHSGASRASVSCRIGDDFQLVIRDNGKGIPLELDGRLDRGHGMASMKQRAKQMQGQCLVESGPGYGTVIRLTLPL